MTENELRYFIDTVTQYFKQISGIGAEIGLPFIKNQDTVVMDYTGLIGISGPKRGGLYFTASRSMLSVLTQLYLGLDSPQESDLMDMAGEISNTIAGNAQIYFGPDYQISVPILIDGKPNDISMMLKPPIFVIPIKWNGHQSYLVVGME
jgi:chemotaxis protein CheX